MFVGAGVLPTISYYLVIGAILFLKRTLFTYQGKMFKWILLAAP